VTTSSSALSHPSVHPHLLGSLFISLKGKYGLKNVSLG
jgi:hypothetical protein